MLPLRRLRGTCRAALCLVLAIACGRGDDPTPRNDTATPAVPPPDSIPVPIPEPVTWDSAAGPALVIAGTTPDEGIVVLPAVRAETDSLAVAGTLESLRRAELTLLSRGRTVGTARITAMTGTVSVGDSCVTWPVTRLGLDTTAASAPSWTVALPSGRATLLPIDSIETMLPADSARLTAELARLASALPGDTASRFRGLPFVVRALYRLRPVPGTEAVLAEIVRQVNQEANPLKQQLLVVAERDSGGAAFEQAWVERTSGMEETLETTFVLAAISLGPSARPTIVLSRESAHGTAFALLQREGPRRWRVRWTSAYAGC